jgi:hypothetical protein
VGWGIHNFGLLAVSFTKGVNFFQGHHNSLFQLSSSYQRNKIKIR